MGEAPLSRPETGVAPLASRVKMRFSAPIGGAVDGQ